MEFKYKTAKEIAEMTDAQKEAYLKEKRENEQEQTAKQIDTAVKEATKDLAKEEDLKGVSDAIEQLKVDRTSSKKAIDVIKEKGRELTNVMNNAHKTKTPFNVVKVKSIQKGHTTYGVIGSDPATTDQALEDYGRTEIETPEIRQSWLDDYLSVSSWDGESFTFSEYVRADVEGTEPAAKGYAAQVNEGELKPELQWKAQNATANLVTFAGYQTYTNQLKLTMEQVYRDTVSLLRADVLAEYEDDMLTWIFDNATDLDTTEFNAKYTNPTLYHVLMAAKAKSTVRLDRAFAKLKPNAMFVNNIDLTLLQLEENSNGTLIIPPFYGNNNQFGFGGIPVIGSDEIPAGKFLVGDLKKVNYRSVMEYQAEVGRIDKQFIHNKFTVVGEKMGIRYIKNQDKAGLIKGDVEAIKTAMEKV